MTSPLEITAVALAIAYLLLVIRQNIWCWAAAIGSTSIYVVLMYDAKLYMEAALQFFYIAIAIYGWYKWRAGAPAVGVNALANEAAPTGPLPITTWPWRHHLYAISAVLLLSTISGYLLSRHSDAALPYLDSFTTFGAVLATWMVARKLLENWHYWFVIDSAAIYLYLQRGLWLTAALFAVYLVLIVIGYRSWRRSMAGQAVVSAY